MHDAKDGSRLRGDGGIRRLGNLGSLVRERKVQDHEGHVLHLMLPFERQHPYIRQRLSVDK
jgi:hypothetical protein